MREEALKRMQKAGACPLLVTLRWVFSVSKNIFASSEYNTGSFCSVWQKLRNEQLEQCDWSGEACAQLASIVVVWSLCVMWVTMNSKRCKLHILQYSRFKYGLKRNMSNKSRRRKADVPLLKMVLVFFAIDVSAADIISRAVWSVYSVGKERRINSCIKKLLVKVVH